jgi:hypothetical protein
VPTIESLGPDLDGGGFRRSNRSAPVAGQVRPVAVRINAAVALDAACAAAGVDVSVHFSLL